MVKKLRKALKGLSVAKKKHGAKHKCKKKSVKRGLPYIVTEEQYAEMKNIVGDRAKTLGKRIAISGRGGKKAIRVHLAKHAEKTGNAGTLAYYYALEALIALDAGDCASPFIARYLKPRHIERIFGRL